MLLLQDNHFGAAKVAVGMAVEDEYFVTSTARSVGKAFEEHLKTRPGCEKILEEVKFCIKIMLPSEVVPPKPSTALQ